MREGAKSAKFGETGKKIFLAVLASWREEKMERTTQHKNVRDKFADPVCKRLKIENEIKEVVYELLAKSTR